MPSRNARTPYPPAAQLFFRLVVSVHDSTRAMKLALIGCDLLTILVVWRWLVHAGRSEWLALGYAWNPFVVLEVSHSGHIDALGALWLVACGLLADPPPHAAGDGRLRPGGRDQTAADRARAAPARHGSGSATRRSAWPCSSCSTCRSRPGRAPPSAPCPTSIDYIRFNGPVFLAVASLTSPPVAAAVRSSPVCATACSRGGGAPVRIRRRGRGRWRSRSRARR